MKLLATYRTELPLFCQHCGTNIEHCVDLEDDDGIKKTVGRTCFKNLFLQKQRPETTTRFNRLFNPKYTKDAWRVEYETKKINELLTTKFL